MLLVNGSVLTFWSSFGFPSRPLSWARVSQHTRHTEDLDLLGSTVCQWKLWINRISLAWVRFLELIHYWVNEYNWNFWAGLKHGLDSQWASEGYRYFRKHWFNLRFWPEALILPANQALFIDSFSRSLVKTDMHSVGVAQKAWLHLPMPLFSKWFLSNALCQVRCEVQEDGEECTRASSSGAAVGARGWGSEGMESREPYRTGVVAKDCCKPHCGKPFSCLLFHVSLTQWNWCSLPSDT